MWSSLVGELGEFMEGLFPPSHSSTPAEHEEEQVLVLPSRRRLSPSPRPSQANMANTEVYA